MGLLLTDLRADFAATRLMPATEASAADVAEGFAALAERAERWFEHEGIAAADRRITRTVDMRYAGQNYELSVAGARRPDHRRRRCDALAAGFAEAHRQRYGFVADGEPVQIVTFRVEATGVVAKAELRAHPDAGPDAAGAIAERRPVWLAEARRLRRHARSMPATRCARATASPAPPSSSRWTRRPGACRA